MKHTSIKFWILAMMFVPSWIIDVSASTKESRTNVTIFSPEVIECKGVVVDNTGEPLPGATVRVIGTSQGTITDIDGKFKLPDVNIGATLEISFVGYAPQSVKFTGKDLKIIMAEDNTVLGEVVVIGYGVTQKRAKVTNSISKVSEETLSVGANANPAQALAGAVAGVKVDITSGSPAATPSITLRGGSNYDGGSNEPLIIVDGVMRSSLADINPNDIESMDVLKDAGATALYGARAGNGVILITTKRGKEGTARVDFNLKVGMNFYDNGYTMCTDEDYLYYYR